ncbi:MAG TPA: aspartate/glutamate racemase family protein [Polyangiaceae bacterium]|nr:aspartate/glutamate racemase family protein [Polyangiaceae bacterium]
MKTIGLIGGMSWESSSQYYRIINERVRRQCGGLHSAKSLMFSVDFDTIKGMQAEQRWGEAARELSEVAWNLENAGADFIVLCTNTMHKVADFISDHVQIPLLHITDPTIDAIKRAGVKKVGLLGTRFTMEEKFYKDRLKDAKLEVLVPDDEEDRKLVDRVIFEELCVGQVKAESYENYVRIMNELVKRGAEGIILGCTEIMLLVRENSVGVPLFDTTSLHAAAAVDYALAA